MDKPVLLSDADVNNFRVELVGERNVEMPNESIELYSIVRTDCPNQDKTIHSDKLVFKSRKGGIVNEKKLLHLSNQNIEAHPIHTIGPGEVVYKLSGAGSFSIEEQCNHPKRALRINT